MKADCHVHFVLDGLDWKNAIGRHKDKPDLAFLHTALRSYQKAGYTYLRDGGDRWGVGAAVRQLAGDYGITYRTPLSPLYKKGHYGGFIGRGFSDLREFANLVAENKRNGADFLKIMISGLMDFGQYGKLSEDGLSPSEIREMVHIGKDNGLAVMAHANGTAAVEAAAAAGVDSVEHGAYLREDALHAMLENGTVWVPTLSAVGNLLGKGRFPDVEVEKILHSALENVETYGKMGGLIACGSDAGAWAVPHDGDTEMQWLKAALKEKTDDLIDRGNRAVMDRF